MKEVGVYEAKTHLPRLIEEVERGETVTITRHGRPVAKLVSVQSPKLTGDELVAEFRAFSRGKTLGDVSIRELIDEGRRE